MHTYTSMFMSLSDFLYSLAGNFLFGKLEDNYAPVLFTTILMGYANTSC